MNRNRFLAAAGGVLLLGLVIWGVSGLLTSDESRITATIEGAAAEVAALRPRSLGRYIDDEYQDELGNDKRQLTQVLLWMRQQIRELDVQMTDPRIEFINNGEHATARFRARVRARVSPGGDWTPLGQVVPAPRGEFITVRLKKQSRYARPRWRITSVKISAAPSSTNSGDPSSLQGAMND